jgi:hypothetical protein
MKFFLWLLGGWDRTRPRPNALESSVISKLPPELIIRIAEFLPLASVVSFCLSCRPIYFVLGTEYLETLQNRGMDQERYNFLTLLERQLLNHILCFHCNKLHSIDDARKYTYSYGYYIRFHLPASSCWIADIQKYHYIHPEFSSTIFRMAMKRHRQCLYFKKLLNLLSHKIQTSSEYGFAKQVSTWSRIVEGSLLIRKQTIFMIPITAPAPFPNHSGIQICKHSGYVNLSTPGQFGDMLRSRMVDIDKTAGQSAAGGARRCQHCLTDFQIDVKRFEAYGVAIFFTCWKDLGEGRSALDEKWQTHVASEGGSKLDLLEFEEGSICSKFEQGEEFEFGSLLNPQNKRKLLRKRPYPWPGSE